MSKKEQERRARQSAASQLLRFSELKERGIARNWPTLLLLIERHNFPPGFYLGANSRVWRESDVAEWIANCPSTRKEAIAEFA